jgi:hypothetical protein
MKNFGLNLCSRTTALQNFSFACKLTQKVVLSQTGTISKQVMPDFSNKWPTTLLISLTGGQQ